MTSDLISCVINIENILMTHVLYRMTIYNLQVQLRLFHYSFYIITDSIYKNILIPKIFLNKI